MSQYFDSGYKTFVCDEPIAQWARVKLDADGRITTAGINDVDIGVATRKTFAAGQEVSVALRNKPGTVKMLAAETLTAGSLVYSAASGRVADTAASTSYPIGEALTSATVDGDIIEVMRYVWGEPNA